MESEALKRDTLINEVTRVEDLGGCFDLSAFPLPMHVAMWHPSASNCWFCAQDALHVYMWVLPRSDQELMMLERDDKGRIKLNTCTYVTQDMLTKKGPKKCVEYVRTKIRDMVMHEFYEALHFRGMRIMNPHDANLRPEDQPF